MLPNSGSVAANTAALAVTNTQMIEAGFGHAANWAGGGQRGGAAIGVQGAKTGTSGVGVGVGVEGFANGTGGMGVLGLSGGSPKRLGVNAGWYESADRRCHRREWNNPRKSGRT